MSSTPLDTGVPSADPLKPLATNNVDTDNPLDKKLSLSTENGINCDLDDSITMGVDDIVKSYNPSPTQLDKRKVQLLLF